MTVSSLSGLSTHSVRCSISSRLFCRTFMPALNGLGRSNIIKRPRQIHPAMGSVQSAHSNHPDSSLLTLFIHESVHRAAVGCSRRRSQLHRTRRK